MRVSSFVENTKRCGHCKEVKHRDEFSNKKSTKDGKNSWCYVCTRAQSRLNYYTYHDKYRAYHAKRYSENKERIIKEQKAYVQRNKPKVNKYFRDRYAKLRDGFIEMYGGCCQCCGEREKAFLAIDHVGGQRGVKRREGGVWSYSKALKEFGSGRYRILCANCNTATRYGKTYPHQLRKES